MTYVDKLPLGVIGESDLRWFVVQSRPHKELFASRNLANQGFRVFLPQLRKSIRSARRVREVERPLFPRYLFVEMDLHRQGWRSILGTYGVTRLVMEGPRPLPAPRGLVEGLIARSDAYSVVDLSLSLTPGQSVELLSGPFAGKIGALVELEGAERVRVLLEILGAKREISVPAGAVAPA